MKKKGNIVLFVILLLALAGILTLLSPFIAKRTTPGLDLAGGHELVYEVSPLPGSSLLPKMTEVAENISQRITSLGISEQRITIEGNNRIRIHMTNVEDLKATKKILAMTADLSFRDTNDEVLCGAEIVKKGGAALAYDNGTPVVLLRIADVKKFGDITEELAARNQGENQIVTWLDFQKGVDSYATEKEKESPRYVSVASVTSRISGDAILRGNFTEQAARELAAVINAGQLPAELKEVYSGTLTAGFGGSAYFQLLLAFIIGWIALALYLLVCYRLPGLIAALVLPLSVFVSLFIYDMMGGILALAAIAALVLSVALACGSNISALEKIKDELYLGRPLQKAYRDGFKASFSVLLDALLPNFFAGILMYIFTDGAVKDFAIMFFAASVSLLFIQRFFFNLLLGLLVKSGIWDEKPEFFGVATSEIPNVHSGEEKKHVERFAGKDILALSKKAVLIAGIIAVLALAMSVVQLALNNGFVNLGADVANSTIVTIKSDSELSVSAIKTHFGELNYKTASVVAKGEDNKLFEIRLKKVLSATQINELSTKLKVSYGEDVVVATVVPLLNRTLLRDTIIMIASAWLALVVYLSLRYHFSYALSALLTLLGDIVISVAIYLLLRFAITQQLQIVILVVITFAICEAVMIFDGVKAAINQRRKKALRKEEYPSTVNQVLQKAGEITIYRIIALVLPLVALALCGPRGLLVYSIMTALSCGVVAGGSLFIQTKIWLWLLSNIKENPKSKKKQNPKKDGPRELTFIGINDIK